MLPGGAPTGPQFRRHRQRVHHHDDDPLDVRSSGDFCPCRRTASNCSSTSRARAHTEVVGEPAVDQVQERPRLAVRRTAPPPRPIDRARRGRAGLSGRIGGGGRGTLLEAAGAAVVVEIVIGDSTTGTADEAAAAREAHRTTVAADDVERLVDPDRDPVEMSVVTTMMTDRRRARGPELSRRRTGSRVEVGRRFRAAPRRGRQAPGRLNRVERRGSGSPCTLRFRKRALGRRRGRRRRARTRAP